MLPQRFMIAAAMLYRPFPLKCLFNKRSLLPGTAQGLSGVIARASMNQTSPAETGASPHNLRVETGQLRGSGYHEPTPFLGNIATFRTGNYYCGGDKESFVMMPWTNTPSKPAV